MRILLHLSGNKGVYIHHTLQHFPYRTKGKLDDSKIQLTCLLFCKLHTPYHLSNFQGRFQGLNNDLLENIVDVRVHVRIPKGFDCLYHQDQQTFQVEDMGPRGFCGSGEKGFLFSGS